MSAVGDLVREYGMAERMAGSLAVGGSLGAAAWRRVAAELLERIDREIAAGLADRADVESTSAVAA